jgi:hypothetical protein
MMISKTIKQTKARINEIMSKAVLFLIIFIPCFYVSFSPLHGQETDVMASGELIVRGVRLEITPAQQTVPINTETVVNTVFTVDNPELVEGMMVKGTLRGPGIKDSITLTTLPNHPFSIPGFTSKGTYILENIQLEKNGKKLVTAEPDQAVIEAMDIIVTKVESRPLTLEEIREKGIVISEENFSVYNFSVGFMVNSQEVKYEFPMVYSGNNEVYIPEPTYMANEVPLPGGFATRVPIPVDIDLPEFEKTSRDKTVTSRTISGVVIFNNDIAFLNQFFSVMFIVSNQAPEESLLALKDVTAKITFPDGLREAETNPPRLMGAPLPVRCPGPDGKIGTADDLDIILATFSGMAEFLAEGLKEGTHIVDIDFEGTLSGLPSGDTPFTGKAAGAVIVRNPEFGITFTHPAVIRKGEEYDVYVNMTNTSPVTANLVSLTMPKTRLVGTILLSDETVSWETIEPGESVTAKFHMQANETGKIRASAFEADSNVSGRFVLSVGVGEQGIPLSPDTLVLPEWAYSLPNELINASLLLLGEAYSIATTPPGGLPEGLPYISAGIVKERAKEFAEAGQRYTYGDNLLNTVEVLTLDWLGSRIQDINFDILRRLTSKGLKFAQQQAIIFNDALNSQTAVDFQRSFAENCSYKPPFISALLSFGGGTRSASLRITDFYMNRMSNEQGSLDLIRNIPYGELYLMEDPGQNPVDFALIGRPDENGYTIEIPGEAEGTFDLSLIVPDTSGGLRQVVFPGVSTQIGSVANITFTSADTSFTMSIDNNGDGLEDSRVAGIITPVQAPPLQLISAIQECSADPAGHATALFFNRSLDPETAKDKTNYYVTDKSIYASFLQPSGRVVLIGTNNPISPFVESLVRAANLKDTSGGLITPSPTEMPIVSTIKTPGGIVFGKVLSALGEPIANAKVQLEERNGYQRTLSFDISDSTGSYQFDFVRILPDPFTIKVQDVSTGKIETVSSRLMSNGQRLQIDIIMRARGSVQGRVLNTSGIPLANAVVTARAEGTGIWESFSTSTSENGEYMISDIPLGNVQLSAGISGQYGSAGTTITAPEQIQTVDITVVGAKTAKVSGRVFYNDGVTPAAEAYVNFYGEHQYSSGTQTDAQGYFQFPTVPIGTFNIKAYNPLTGKQGGYVTGELVENQDYSATIIFRGTGRIYGKILSYDNIPQSGVLVYLSGTSFYMDTDSNGNFDFQEVPVGSYGVNAIHRTTYLKAYSWVNLITEGQEAYVSMAFPNTLKGSITGTVYDMDGTTKLPYTRVYACDDNYRVIGADTSSPNAVFTIGNLSTGNYTLFVANTDADLAGVARTAVQFPGHQAQCNVQFLGKGKVNINVFASDGQSGIMADVIFRRSVFELTEGSYIGFRGIEEQYTTDENGHLEIDNVYIGAISASAENAFYPRGAYYSGKITSPGQEVNVDLVMKPTGKVKVTVVNWDGQPVPGAALEFSSWTLNYKGIYTDENGVYEFTLVPPGNFRITANDSESGLKGICYGTMGQDGDLVEVTLKLKGKGQVNGVVKNQSDVLIPYADVTLKNIGFPHETFKTKTDANGQFTIYGVWEGKFSVSAFFSDLQIGGRTEGEITGHNAQANVEVVLEAIGTVKGRVMSPDGVSEMTDTQVVLYHSKFSYKAVGYFYVSQEGGYTFENIPKGQFYLEAIHPASGRKGKRSGSITTEGQVVEVDVYLEGRGTVTGTFYDGSGANPVPHASIKITSKGAYPFTLESTTDAQGNFTFAQVARGDFDLDATDPANGLKGAASGQVEYDGETVYIDVIAQGWGIVKGIVYDAQGTGKVNGAMVKLTQGYKVLTEFSGPDPNNPNDPKQDGEYIFTLVPVGSFSLVAYDSVNNSRDYGTASGRVEFHGQVATVDITFKGLGTINGRVLDVVNGVEYPRAGIPVTLTSGNEKIPSVSNSEGIYSFTDVRMGPFSLEATQDITNLSASGSGELTEDGQTVTIDLILESAGSVTGRVLNPDGTTPAKDAYVKLKGTNFTKYYITGDNGVFEFNAVRLGGFTLEVQGYNQEGKARVSGQIADNGEIVNAGDLVLDNELPTVTAINFPDGSPVNGSAGIPLSTSLKIHFSEEIAASSITSSTIYLNSNQGKVSGSLALQPDGKTVVFTPSLLSSFVLYTLNVTTSVEDIAGNTLETTVSASFTTSDIQPPVVVAINPANNARGVPVDTVITAAFNEPVDDSKFTGPNFVVKKGDLSNGIPVNPQSLVFNESKTSVTFTPGSPLQPNASYTVWLNNFCDFSNNLQTAALTSHFTTIDTLGPTFKSISPPDGATITEGASVTVTVTFNESDIAVVHFSVNGQTKYSDTSSPYKYQFTTPLISQTGNSILVEVLAVDNAGNQSNKANLTINLKQDVPPQITLTGPPVSTVLPGGTINCSITATDDLGLSKVVLTAQGGNLNYSNTQNISNSSPSFTRNYSIAVPPDIQPNTDIILHAHAVDVRGNMSNAKDIQIHVPQDELNPTVNITSPSEGSRFKHNEEIIITANVSDDVGLKEVRIYLDDQLLATHTQAPYTATYTVPPLGQEKQSVVKVEAEDLSGKVSQDTVNIVQEKLVDLTAPQVKIITPSEGSLVFAGENLRIKVDATDDEGVAHVEIYVDDQLFTTLAQSPYEVDYTVPAGAVAGSTITIKAIALDVDNKTGDDQVAIEVTTGTFLPDGTVIEADNTDYENHTIIINEGTVTINGAHTFSNVLVKENGSLTHSACTTTAVYKMQLSVTGKLVIGEAANVNVYGRGYLGGKLGDNSTNYGYTLGNTSAGGSYRYAGGSFGGYGGTYEEDGVNKIYGSIDNPSDPGSGGGGLYTSSNYNGGSGGGVIIISTSEIVNDGYISANGQNSGYGGAGSGGSIKINTTLLRGSGTISANGGNSSQRAGGGGGRIALYYENAWEFNLENITAYGGINTNAVIYSRYGSAGTVYLQQINQEPGLIIDNRDNDSYNPLIFPSIGPSTITSLSANVLTDTTASFMPGSLIGMELIPDINNKDQTFTIIDNDNNSITIDSADGDLTQVAGVDYTYGGMVVFAGHLQVQNTYIAEIGGNAQLGNLSVLEGSRLSHPAATASKTYDLSLKVPGRVYVDNTSWITVSGRGYLGGYQGDNNNNNGRTLGNTTSGGSEYGSGGSYGGSGGKWNVVGQVYGSIYLPSDPGAGGGGSVNNSAGSGGGVILIETGELQLDGGIQANGDTPKSYGGGGAGGSILLKVTALKGSGIVTANGGNSKYNAGGGGGRIAVYYQDASQFDLAKITAYGGIYTTGTNSNQNAGAGTIYMEQKGQTGEIFINNNATDSKNGTPLAGAPPGTITGLEEHKMVDANADFIPGSLVGMLLHPNISNPKTFTITSNNETEITVEYQAGDGLTNYAQEGDQYLVKQRVKIIAEEANLHVDGNSAVTNLQMYNSTLTVDGILEADQLTLRSGSIITHSPTILGTTYTLSIKAQELDIGEGCSIDVNGCGYPGAYERNNTNVDDIGVTYPNTIENGSTVYGGGSYGGYGGSYRRPSSTHQVNKPYGSITAPVDPGSGGGGNDKNTHGTSGGGVIRLQAGNLTLNGTITANGISAANWHGTGSGGSIWIDVTTISGQGFIRANGGSSGSDSGAGGGGRIALYYENAADFDLNNITAYGGINDDGADALRNGGAGTIYLKKTNDQTQLPQLIVKNRGQDCWESLIFPVIEPAQITSISGKVLENTNADYMPGSLVGMTLIPNIDDPENTYLITANNSTTITVDRDITGAQAVDTYKGLMVFAGHLEIVNSISDISRDVEVESLTLSGNSVLRHPGSTANNETYLLMKVSDRVIIESGSSIDVSKKGYPGGYQTYWGASNETGITLENLPGGGSYYHSGASHGGQGGAYGTNYVGLTYGSLYKPLKPGAGGGGYSTSHPGFNGGGVLHIITNLLELNGAVYANGGTNVYPKYGGAGAGGSILLEVKTIKGAGKITANGGGNWVSAAGGGGRVAVYYENISEFNIANIHAYGGLRTYQPGPAFNGGAGTIYLNDLVNNRGELVVDNNNIDTNYQDRYSTPLPAVGQGIYTMLEANRLENSTASWIPGALTGIKLNPNPIETSLFTITTNTGTEIFTDSLDGNMTETPQTGGQYIGEHLLFNLTVKGSARLFTTDRIQVSGTLIKELGSTLKAENHQ